MSVQKPGEVRCPTCGYSTPIAAFCTHCGADLPPDAPVRPRGMDRDELEDRIRGAAPRARNPFRRGASADDSALPPGPERYVAEPTDLRARSETEEGAPPEPRIDVFSDPPKSLASSLAATGGAQAAWPEADREFPPSPLRLSDDREDRVEGGALAAPAFPRARYDADDGGYAGREHAPGQSWAAAHEGAGDRGADAGADESGGGFDDGNGPSGYDYPEYPDDRRRSGGTGALAIVGFVVLGVAALLGGAILSGVLNTATPAGAASSSPTASASTQPSASQGESAQPTGGESPSSSTPAASQSSGPDNFTAKVQPCASAEMTFKGCAKDGSTITSDQVWVWVGFYQAAYNDVIGVKLVENANGAATGDGSIQLGQDNIGCKPDKACTGYLYFTFDQLQAGGYTIKISRNGQDVAQATLTVNA
jgi:hypothetical protein